MAQMTTSAYQDLVNLLEITMIKTDFSLESVARNSGMFIQKSKPDNTGKYIRFEEFEGEQYASIKPEGESASIYKTQIGYAIDAEIVRLAKNVEYTYEAQHQDKYDTIAFSTESALKSLVSRFDLDLQHRVSFASATSYTNKDGQTVNIAVGDGLALASTAHTVRGSATTFRNVLANNPQASRGSLEAMEKMWVENTINQFGEKVGKPANAIWSTDDPNTVNTIRELMQATAEVSAPNAGVPNVYRAKYKHVVLPRVATTAAGLADSTKAKYWGLCATGIDGWQAFYAVNEEPHVMALDQSNHYDVRTDIYSFPVRMGYAIAVLSGRFFTISYGDGTA
jgi:hypothetical protein